MKTGSFRKEEERLRHEIEKLENNFKNSVFSNSSKSYRDKVSEEITQKIKSSENTSQSSSLSGFESSLARNVNYNRFSNSELKESKPSLNSNNVLNNSNKTLPVLKSNPIIHSSIATFEKSPVIKKNESKIILSQEKPKNDYLLFENHKSNKKVNENSKTADLHVNNTGKKLIKNSKNTKSLSKKISLSKKPSLNKQSTPELDLNHSSENHINRFEEIEHYIDEKIKAISGEIRELIPFTHHNPPNSLVISSSADKTKLISKSNLSNDESEKLIYEKIHDVSSEPKKEVLVKNANINPMVDTKTILGAHKLPKSVEFVSEKEIRLCAEDIKKLKNEMAKVIVGQGKVIDGLIRGLICDGHVLLEGAPGIAKTLTIKSLGEATGCIVKRVQFTVDLLPTDIIGITSYTPGKGFEIIKGPIFTNFLIADEINRSPPKTQSALIEGMQEKQVTIGKEDFKLPSPFFVMATKNPIENIGVYTLPEAQVDRFLFNIIMEYPNEIEEKKIMEDNTTTRKFEEYKLKPVIKPADIVRMQNYAKKVYLGDHIKNYIINIVSKTRDPNFKYAEYISYGASPRASIALFIAAKATALMEGRNYVIPEDVKLVILDVLRHRIILSYKATVKRLRVEDIISQILDDVEAL